MNLDDYAPLVKLALSEDLGDRGDVTSSAVFDLEFSQAVLLSKDTGILAGRDVFCYVMGEVDHELKVDFMFDDGAALKPGNRVAVVRGRVLSILTAERCALNFLSFLSGIATAAGAFSSASSLAGNALILDTRKTLPGYRNISKYAVRVGGGKNHRNGLYDMVLLKDNHIDFSGSISEAVKRVRRRWADELRIEVECRSLEEVKEALECGVDVIMLDNMDEKAVRRAVDIRNSSQSGKIELEASGNMDLEQVPAMSAAGVDYISVGGLTHSVKSFDFSLKTDLPK
jgi:nicotinate-nucleotide pyrophosphorylase (carboxylating)